MAVVGTGTRWPPASGLPACCTRSRILHISPGISHVIQLPFYSLLLYTHVLIQRAQRLTVTRLPRAPQLPQRQWVSNSRLHRRASLTTTTPMQHRTQTTARPSRGSATSAFVGPAEPNFRRASEPVDVPGASAPWQAERVSSQAPIEAKTAYWGDEDVEDALQVGGLEV